MNTNVNDKRVDISNQFRKGFLASVVGLMMSSLAMVSTAAEPNDSSVHLANAYSLKLHNIVAASDAQRNKNLFMSALGIRTAMAMTYMGARSETADEMERAFGYSEDIKQEAEQQATQHSRLQSQKSVDQFDFSVANALWMQQGGNWQPDYMVLINNQFGAEVKTVDFRKGSNHEDIVNNINQWASDQTNARIKKIVGRGDVSSSTRLILLNAMYFLGDWVYPFANRGDGGNRKRLFQTEAEGQVQADFMSHDKHLFGPDFYENEDIQVLDLPYMSTDEGKRLSMTIFLPREKGGLHRWEQQMDIKRYNNLIEQLEPVEPASGFALSIQLPKWEFSTPTMDMTEHLRTLGVNRAFERATAVKGANFSGISKNGLLSIDKVAHKAFIKVDEKGTEAAAVTAVMMIKATTVGRRYKTKDFIADHPFFYVIRHQDSGRILFSGRVANPDKSQ